MGAGQAEQALGPINEDTNDLRLTLQWKIMGFCFLVRRIKKVNEQN